MKRQTHLFTLKRRGLRLMAMTALATTLSTPLLANDSDKGVIFDKPPSAAALADILFPSSGRSIVIGGSATEAAPEGPKLFGLLINFEFGTATIVQESLPFLDSVGQMLNLDSVRSESIVIEGHTDAVGESHFNDTLSQDRALAVKDYLVSVHNVDKARLHPVGKGEVELFDANNPTAAVNRRVQFRPLDNN